MSELDKHALASHVWHVHFAPGRLLKLFERMILPVLPGPDEAVPPVEPTFTAIW
jgi:hypothetical protein